MEKFNQSELDLIKQSQQAIIKNLNTLDVNTRSRLFSKFQNISYKKIGFYETKDYGVPLASAACYFPYKNTIYIVDSETANYMNLEILLHETIHAVSDDTNDDRLKSGLTTDEYKFLNNNTMVYFHEGVGINEGLTQFFTKKFINLKDGGAYIIEVNIVELLSETCGYENLKDLYFNNNLTGLKNLIKQKYHLKDYNLIDKLFSQMDILTNTKELFNCHYSSLIKSCYETMLQMETIKRSFEEKKNITLTDEEIENYLSQFINHERGNNYEVIENIIKNKNNLTQKDSSNKHSINFYRTLTANIVESIINNNETKLYLYKNKLGANALDVLKILNHSITFAKDNEMLNSYDIFESYLNLLHDKNGKICLDKFNDLEKYEFIANSMFGPYKNSKKGYKHFYVKDLIQFINNDLNEYKAFSNRNAMEYIFLDVEKISPKVRDYEEFKRVYQTTKEDCVEYFDLIKVKTNEEIL